MSGDCDFGLIGLAVMGENLALNVESRGYKVAVYNRTTEKVDDLINGKHAAFPAGSGGDHTRRAPGRHANGLSLGRTTAESLARHATRPMNGRPREGQP